MPVLEQLFECTELLATEQYPSASCILPLLDMLLNTILDTQNETFFMTSFKNIIKSGLQSHFLLPGSPNFNKTFLALASFLDPRHKSLKFMANDEERPYIMKFLLYWREVKLMQQSSVHNHPLKRKREQYLIA